MWRHEHISELEGVGEEEKKHDGAGFVKRHCLLSTFVENNMTLTICCVFIGLFSTTRFYHKETKCVSSVLYPTRNKKIFRKTYVDSSLQDEMIS